MHAERCPICNGMGKTNRAIGFLVTADIIDCHGCAGKGWVEVHDEPNYHFLVDFDYNGDMNVRAIR